MYNNACIRVMICVFIIFNFFEFFFSIFYHLIGYFRSQNIYLWANLKPASICLISDYGFFIPVKLNFFFYHGTHLRNRNYYINYHLTMFFEIFIYQMHFETKIAWKSKYSYKRIKLWFWFLHFFYFFIINDWKIPFFET